jgi:hypothetical protein
MVKIKEFIIESEQLYYHGSSTKLPVGFILTYRDEEYENDWGDTDFYHILEIYRPEHMIAHKKAVFMTDNIDDIDIASGGSEWLFTVQPLGKVEKHDMNWGSEVSMLMDTDPNNYEAIEQAAKNYWNGVPHTNESVWEYLTSSARIVAVEPY